MIHSIEILEARIAPATLLGKSVTYTDTDGETVTVKLVTKGPVTESLFQFDSAFGTSGPQTLQKIALTTDSKFAGASIIVKVKKGVAGDGKVDIGAIEANVDLGSVTIPGDLGRILVGDNLPAKSALAKLSVLTLGQKGALTQAAPVSETSTFLGSVGSVAITGSVFGANLNFQGGATAKVGSIKVGGSLFPDGANSANILASGNVGSLTILGDIQGTSAMQSAQVKVNGNLGSFTLGSKAGQGSLYGGTAVASGWVQVLGSLKKATIHGSIYGGTTALTGFFSVVNNLGTLKIGNSIFGGNSLSDYSGAVTMGGNLGTATIGGSVIGGSGRYSGYLNVDGFAKRVTMGVAGKTPSNLIGGDGQESGVLFAGNGFGKISITGDLVSGQGSLSGAIDSNDRIGTVKILGNVLASQTYPASITAWHAAATTDKKNPTIGSIFIGKNATGLLVRAGFNDNTGVDADAQIGSVVVKGNFLDSSIVAGVRDVSGNGFGNADDESLALSMGATNQSAILSKIGSVKIGGIAGTTALNATAFGVVAQVIGSVKVGKLSAALTKGPTGDAATLLSGPVGLEQTLLVREVA